jgi:DNA-binding SARP family transcriptional activator/tetratricopeptide (TPR) repeat protein
VEARLPAGPQRLAFAYLVLRRERPVPREELAAAVAAADADALLAGLADALGPGLIAGGAGRSLALGPDPWIDVEAAHAAVPAARAALAAGRAADARLRAEEALTIVRQPLLRGLDRPWLDEHRRALQALRPALLDVVGHAALTLGGSVLARGTAAARELAALDPLHEPAHALLIRLLAAAGDVAAALRAYDDLRVRLRDELGTVPSPELVALHHRLLTVPGEPAAPGARPRHGLPPPLAPAVGQLPFTGRERQLAWLTDSWADIGVGARRVIVIAGEPGIGKTRAAAELARRVHADGSLVLYGRCDEGLAVPYQPYVEALRRLIATVDADRLRTQLGGLAPELVRLLPELSGWGSPVPADAASGRFALFEAVVALLEITTARQPTLLVIDDVQWAAPATLQLLRHVIRSERPLALLVVVTFRSTEVRPDEPLAQLLADLQRDHSAECIDLDGLDEAAIDSLLRAAVGPALADRAPGLAASVHAETAGNPFFVQELVAHLLESDAVLPVSLDIPEGLRSVVRHRVARLSAPAREVLTSASVATGPVDVALLDAVLPRHAGLLDALDETVAAGLLVESGRGEFGFAHALVRHAIHDDLGAARRVRLHRRLGEALEARGDAQQHVEALAHHFAHAAADGQAGKAAAYALAAGRSAAARFGYEEAAGHYERGLDALAVTTEPHARQRCELLLALGAARWGAGALDAAREACRQAAELADELGDATALAHAALGFCGPPRFEGAIAVTRPVADLLERALARLGEGDTALRAQLMGRLAAYTHAADRTPVLARQALAMARRAADGTSLADVLASTHWATRGPDALHESLALAEELGRVADEVGDTRLRARAHGWRLDYLLELGDIDAVERELDALQQVAEPRKDRFVTWLLAARRASHAYLAGRLDRCDELAHDALTHSFEGHDENAAHTFGAQMVFLRREQGRLDELVGTVERLVVQYPHLPGWRCALAYVYAQLERPADARRELDVLARDGFSGVARDALWLSNVSALCDVVAFVGDVPRAHVLYELVSPYADRCVVILALLSQGSAARPLGLLATTLSRYDEAERHFEQALAMNARVRSPLWMAHTRHEHARMLLLRNGPGDRDKALALLDAALATADELRLDALAGTARALRLAAGAAGPPLAPPRPA